MTNLLSTTQPLSDEVLYVSDLEQQLCDRNSGEQFKLVISEIALHESEWIALVGPTGCGKTTLLTSLALLREPTQVGTFIVTDRRHPDSTSSRHDVRQFWLSNRQRPIEALRRRVLGYAPQRPELIPSFKVSENVEIPLQLNHANDIRERVRELLAAFSRPDKQGIPDLIRVARNRPHQLSGGQAQRVGLARAIAHRPALLLADEPTSNLDEQTAIHVLRFLDKMRRDEGTAIVMITHDETLVSRFADRIIRMGVISENVGGVIEERLLAPVVDSQPLTTPIAIETI